MPNYCDNSLRIKATPEVMNEIFAFVKSEEREFDFNRIVSMPKGILDSQRQDNWATENWGTKWNSDSVVIDGDTISFLTAWSPCLPVIATLAEHFPDAHFWYSYYEAGMCFCGAAEFDNGECSYYMEGVYYEGDPYSDESEGLVDEKFPVKSCGSRYELEDVHEELINGQVCDAGKIFYREYENGKIYRIVDGAFLAERV